MMFVDHDEGTMISMDDDDDDDDDAMVILVYE
jgi:pectate lyase